MIIATYKQYMEGPEYPIEFYKEYTSIYKDKYGLQIAFKRWEDEGTPMIILGIWEL